MVNRRLVSSVRCFLPFISEPSVPRVSPHPLPKWGEGVLKTSSPAGMGERREVRGVQKCRTFMCVGAFAARGVFRLRK